MNQITIFKSEEFGELRSMNIEGEAWFVGKDVALVLGYANPTKAVITHVDEEDKQTMMLEAQSQNGTLLNKTKTAFINESGLYSLILSSKLPKAREFKHWITAIVLPQIRKTGGYIPVNQEDDEKTILCKAIGIMKRTIEQKDALIAKNEELLEAQKPLVRFAEAVTASEGSILIGELAKLLRQNGVEIGRTRLFRWLREKGYLFKKTTEPIQKWVEQGLFETHVSVISTHHGDIESVTTKVTGKGQRYFIDKFIKNYT